MRYAEPIKEVMEEYEEANAEIEDEDFDGKHDAELNSTTSRLRRVLFLIERIANSEGVCTRRNKRPGESIKIVNVLKAEMIEPFKKRYAWHFKERNVPTPVPKTFTDVIASQSIIST